MNPAASPARTAAIVPAAGRGERLGPGAPKALRSIGDIPILVHAVRSLTECGRVGLVVVAAPPDGVEGVAALLAPFAQPTHYGLGKSGWVTASFGKGDHAPLDILKSWIEESYRAVAPKKLVAELGQD